MVRKGTQQRATRDNPARAALNAAGTTQNAAEERDGPPSGNTTCNTKPHFVRIIGRQLCKAVKGDAIVAYCAVERKTRYNVITFNTITRNMVRCGVVL